MGNWGTNSGTAVLFPPPLLSPVSASIPPLQNQVPAVTGCPFGLTLSSCVDIVGRIYLYQDLPSAQDDLGVSLSVADITLSGPDTMNAPWGLDSRFTLVVLACDFFNIAKLAANRAVIGKKLADSGSPKPLTVSDFLKYLEVKKAFPRPPNAFRVARIVEQMVSAGLLVRVAPEPANDSETFYKSV